MNAVIDIDSSDDDVMVVEDREGWIVTGSQTQVFEVDSEEVVEAFLVPCLAEVESAPGDMLVFPVGEFDDDVPQ